jgi:hypothetical protein
MLISIVNRTGTLVDAEVQRAVRAINRQLAEDFEPHWQFGARLRLDSAGERPPRTTGRSMMKQLPDRRGDAVVYLVDHATVADAEGYHDRNGGDVPCGFVFLETCEACGDPWTMTLSHEVIELVGDPLNNLTVQGPHPHDHRHLVFHTFELCDPVQNEHYEIDGVVVSNFVLPGWFTRGDPAGARNDFLGRPTAGDELPSFTMAPGGYLCFWDPARDGDKWTSLMNHDDPVAAKRLAAKRHGGLGRGLRRQHPER